MNFYFRTIPSKIFIIFFSIAILFGFGFSISSYLFKSTINSVVLHLYKDIVTSFNDQYLEDFKTNRLDVISNLIDEKIDRVALIFSNLEQNVEILSIATKDVYDHHLKFGDPQKTVNPINFSKQPEFVRTLKKDKHFLKPVSFEFPDILINDSKLLDFYSHLYWRLRPFLRGFYGRHESVLWTYVGFEEDGSVLNYPGNFSEPDGYNPRTRPWYKKAHQNRGRIVWTEPYFDTGNKSLVLSVAKATYQDHSTRPLFVSAADIVVDQLIREITNIDIEKNMLPILILNESNQVIFKREDEDLQGHWEQLPKFIRSKSFFSKKEYESYASLGNQKYGRFEFKNRNYFVFKRNLPRTNWTIVFLLDANYIEGFANKIENKFNILAGQSQNAFEKSKSFSDQILFLITAILIIFILVSFFILNRMVVGPLRKLSFLIKNFSKIDLEEFQKKDFKNASRELVEISNELKLLKESEILYRKSKLQQEILKAENIINAQISHDIRSPVAALNMVLSEIGGLPEEHRLIIRNASQRINDIANGLLRKGRQDTLALDNLKVATRALDTEPVMIVALLDYILSEKRAQFRERLNLEISGELKGGYGLFCKLNSTEFSRVVSNLINNSAEAMSMGGLISVTINSFQNEVNISVHDNGSGIPEEILSKLGERGLTNGKDGLNGGTGLGIYHAKRTIELLGGRLYFDSTIGVGTKVTIILPKCKTPNWFVESIRLGPESVVISLDDDQTIHQIWAERIRSYSAPVNRTISHISFTSCDKFEQWFKFAAPIQTPLFLIDFEFLNQNRNGLTLIEQMRIGDNAILVTSRFEDPEIQAKAEHLGVRILPKTLAAFVPIDFENAIKKYTAILIDDDITIVHSTWKAAAKNRNVSILCFSNVQEFWKNSNSIDPSSPVFVDVDLGQGIRGEHVAVEILKGGFKNVSLTTGFDPESIAIPDGIVSVVGKYPVLDF